MKTNFKCLDHENCLQWFNDSSEHSLHYGAISLYIVLINIAAQLHCHSSNGNVSVFFQQSISLLFLRRVDVV